MAIDTKSYAANGLTRQYTVPGGVRSITFYLWGAGGAAGGDDAGHRGGSGSPGDLVIFRANVSAGDVIDLAVGTKGLRGSNSASNAPGGQGGGGYKAANGNVYAGGNGGRAGPSGSSGGGGGGGGATVVAINGNVVAVSGGGGGGGGSGNNSNGGDATIVWASGNVTAGQNGQVKSGDGGGGGGGGAGYSGGSGGGTNDGDNGADPGGHGSSWISPAFTGNITKGSGTTAPVATGYDIGSFAAGGVGTTGGANTNGGDGYAIVQIEYSGLPSYKVNGAWKGLKGGFVKAPFIGNPNGTKWFPIVSTFYKVNGRWQSVITGTYSLTNLGTGIRWNASGTRPYA